MGHYPIPLYVKILNFIPFFNWGAFGVALFFLISGFVIPLSLNKYSKIGFAIGRFCRIYPIYILGFTITLISIVVTTYYFKSNFPYYFREVIIHYMLGLRDILWSRSIDGIIWTLEIELKFYIMCILLYQWMIKGSKKVFIILTVMVIIALIINANKAYLSMNLPLYKAAFIFTGFIQIFTFMNIGVVYSFYYQKKLYYRSMILIVSYLCILYYLQWVSGYHKQGCPLLSYGIAMGLFMFSSIFQTKIFNNTIIKFLSDISYPLYVIHGVYGYALLNILIYNQVSKILSLFITIVSVIIISYVMHIYIEMPVHEFGRSIAKKVSPPPKPSS